MPSRCIESLGQMTVPEQELAEQLAFSHGRSYDSYLLLDDGRSYFFGPDECGLIAFARWHKTAYVIGGLLAPESAREALLASFLEYTDANGMEPLFFNALGEDLPLFRRFGLHASKIGEEPVVDLQATNWTGGRFTWVRRQENACRREGIGFREVDPSSTEYRETIVPQIEDVSRQHLDDTVYGRELSLVVGQLQPLQLRRRRLFVGDDDKGVAAFIVATPAYDGDYWAIETYRRRPDAAPGIVAAMMLHVARQLKDEGVRVLSLCQVPGLRSDQTTFSPFPVVRHGLRIWWQRLGWFYDPVRLYHFKSRFRPAYRECFLVGRNPGFVPMLVFALKWGVVWPDFRRLPRQMLRRIRKWGHSAQLADPLAEQHVLVEKLAMEHASPFVLAAEASDHTQAPSVTTGTTHSSQHQPSGAKKVAVH